MSIDLDRPINEIMATLRDYFSNDYIYAIFIFFLFLLIAFIITVVYKYFFLVVSKKTKTKVDDLIIEKAIKPIYIFVIITGFKAIIAALELEGNSIENILKTFNSLLVIVFAYILIVIFRIIAEHWGKAWQKRTKSKYSDTVMPLIEKIIYILFILSAIIVVLDIWGIEVAPFLAGLGIAGLAIGLALQDSLKDFVGGVNLILDNAYTVGDKVKLDSGEVGTIFSISIRSTRIKTYDNNVIIIPNHIMASSKIINYAQPKSRERGSVPFGVVYGSDIEKTKSVALEALKKVKEVLEDPAPSVEFLEMADFSLNFRALFWVSSFSDRWDIERDVVQKLYEELNNAGIEFAFPTSTIYLKRGEKDN
ncbi:MAG: mechanosensitive ion channel family protein [Candidatus Methanofastidiosa archaeon]|nr:mechanosensitive ion channel family protein [Candidatus Methanofastidiosa archaeon]